jgi:hypothetical protein
MLPYKKIPCQILDRIQKETLHWLDLHPINGDQFWNKIDSENFIKRSPALVEFSKSIGLYLRECAILITHTHDGVGLHVDEKPITAKINFPILNTAGSITEWYDVPTDNFPVILNQFGKEIPDLSTVDVAQFTKLGEVELDTPIVFNSQIPHRVRIQPDARLPRIVLSCMFFKEPLNYLL